MARVFWALLLFAACSSGPKGGPPRFERFPQETTPGPDAYPVVGSVVLLERSTLNFTVDVERGIPLARLRHYHREKVLRPETAKLDRVVLPFDPGSAITDLIVQVVAEDGTTTWIDTIGEISADDGRRAKAFKLPPLPAGSVVEYTYDQYFKDPRFLPPLPFQDRMPTLRSELAVIVPRGFEVDFRFYLGGVPVNKPPERFEVDEGTRLSWSLADLPPVFEEVSMPAVERIVPAAQILFVGATIGGRRYAGFRSWEDVRRWFFEERVGNWSQLSPEQQAEARRIAGDAPLEERALKLLEVVARDLPWSPGPRIPLWRADAPSAQNTLLMKHGNGTSRGLLLTALLRAAGIEALPAFYADRRKAQLTPDFPVIHHIDGICAVINRPQGPLILDPADLTVSADVPAAHLQGTRIVAMRPDGAEVTLVPIASPADSRSAISYDLKVDPSGVAIGNAEARLTGAEASALRALLLPAKPEQYPDLVSDFLGLRGAIARFDAANIADLSALRRPLVIKTSVQISDVLKDEGEGAFVPLSKLLGVPGWQMTPRRRQPLVLGAPRQAEVTITLLFPEDHKPQSPPPPIEQRWATGSHVVNVRAETAHRLGIRAATEVSGLELTPDEYPAFFRAREASARALMQVVPISRPPPKTYQY